MYLQKVTPPSYGSVSHTSTHRGSVKYRLNGRISRTQRPSPSTRNICPHPCMEGVCPGGKSHYLLSASAYGHISNTLTPITHKTKTQQATDYVGTLWWGGSFRKEALNRKTEMQDGTVGEHCDFYFLLRQATERKLIAQTLWCIAFCQKKRKSLLEFKL